MKKNYDYQKKIFILLFILLFVIFMYLTSVFSGFLVPIIFAFFTAMFLHPFIHKLHETRIPSWLSTLIVYSFFILIIGIIFTIISISFTNFIGDLPGITEKMRKNITDLIKSVSDSEIFQKYFYKEKMTDTVINLVKNALSLENFTKYIIKPLSATLDVLTSFGLYILYLVFIIPGMETISEKIINAFPEERGAKINDIITSIKEKIQSYIVTKSVISFITGLLSFITCFAFGIKYALLWGAVMFLFNFIPYIGSFIALMFPLILCIIQYQSLLMLVFLAAILIGIQAVMGNIVEPKFLSRGVNLSPIVIITSLLVWGYLWGIAGVILAVPIMSAINLVCENFESLKPVSIMISVKKKDKKP